MAVIILFLLFTPIISQEYSLIWYDTMGSDTGDWRKIGDAQLGYDSSNCQTNLCAKLVDDLNDFTYIERETNVSQYTALQIQVYIKSQSLEQDEKCQIWYKYSNNTYETVYDRPPNSNFGPETDGVYTRDIPASLLPLISISLEIVGEKDNDGNDRCYFDNVYLYGIPITNNPTVIPTLTPTLIPTTTPTVTPTNNPTVIPTLTPTLIPTTTPTITPTNNPSKYPSKVPSNSPTTDIPTITPTNIPTIAPITLTPTQFPTLSPTNNPSKYPSNVPSITPTISPTMFPTMIPSKSPSESSGIYIEKTTENMDSFDGGNKDELSQQNGFMHKYGWYSIIVMVIFIALLIICIIALVLYFVKKKRSDMNIVIIANDKNTEMNEMEQVSSVSNIIQMTASNNMSGDKSGDLIVTTKELDINDMMMTPNGVSKINEVIAIDEGNDDENSLYIKGPETLQTAGVDEGDEHDHDDSLYGQGVETVQNEDVVTTGVTE